jgi:hypothetical protein
MTYDEQIKILKAARDGKRLFAKEKGNDSKDWEFFDPRCTFRNSFRAERDVQFNFQKYEYKVYSGY